MLDLAEAQVGVIGLGYVGLPLAVEFGKQLPTIGYDRNSRRIRELRSGNDNTRELDTGAIAAASRLSLTDTADELAHCNIYIVAVPTPIDRHKRPDLGHLQQASALVGAMLKPRDIVIYESTVYPGATEEVCVPILAAESGLVFNTDFWAGYSPERINPGDARHNLASVIKVTSGSTAQVADFIDALYAKIIPAGTHKAGSIRVAEAAKAIENVQRDVNIALINELALIFNRIGIDTEEVLLAAETKWNFLSFRPGLVGGHCIGVDPYYLTHKALETGYQPTLIPASRALNDSMGDYVADRVIRLMAEHELSVVGSRFLIMGMSFKENCADLRNTRVVDIVATLKVYHAHVEVYDPWVDADEAQREYAIRPVQEPANDTYDAVIIAVGHRYFRELGTARIRAFGKPGCILFDTKYVFARDEVDGRL